ncbi:MAG: hypothetical protein ACR2F9_07825 [Longimicrobiaceae bacterium]
MIAIIGGGTFLGSLIFLHGAGPLRNLWYLSPAGALTVLAAGYAWAFEPGH